MSDDGAGASEASLYALLREPAEDGRGFAIKNVHVVLVEDEVIVRKGISLSVNWEEYGVEIADEAANGEEALQKCLACCPEIVITDIRMPQMDGLELVEKLKGLLPEVKIIILSGYEDFGYAKRALVLGVNEYLLKHLKGRRYRVFLMRVDQKPVWDEHEQKGNRDLYQFAVCNIGEEILKEKMGKGTLVFYEGIDFAGILCMKNLERFSIMNILEEIQCKIRDYLKISVSVGVGNVYPKLEDLRLSFQEAREAVKYRFYAGHSAIQFFSELKQPKTWDFAWMAREERQAVLCQKDGDREGTVLTASRVFEKFKEDRPKEETVRDSCSRFVNMLVKEAGEDGADIAGCLGKDFNAYTDMQKMETLEEVRNWMLEIIGRLHQELERHKNQRYSILVGRAMKYMEKNYARDISLTELSGEVGVTPNYFSRIFKEEVGINFVDWLNRLRIEKAVQMMDDSTMKIYEIAERVGFSDYKYFSVIFKKMIGCTPRQYQKR